MARLGAALRMLRWYTLLAPAAGMASGGVAALASEARVTGVPLREAAAAHWPLIALGAAMAAILNGASNVLNQITERRLDAINKPDRMLPAGRLPLAWAWSWCAVLYGVALAMAWAIQPRPGVRDAFWCSAAAALATIAYSAPPIYAKARGWWANLTIAVPRGALLKVAGWACVAPSLASAEAWWIGWTFALFLFGAASTKDFADAPGDAAVGCRTLVVRHGAARVARWIAPSFVLPWLLLPLGLVVPSPGEPILHASPVPLLAAALGLAAYGTFVAWRMVSDLGASAHEGNHPSWTHMYALMLAAQVALAIAYCV